MEVKSRTIQMGREGNCLMVDAYGIENGEILRRYVVISGDLYQAFQKNPDEDMQLDTFLKRNHVDSEWKRVTADELPGLLQDTNLGRIASETAGSGEEKPNKAYQKVYDALSEEETLIADPFVMDIFNEAIRDDSDLADWESVFPFFR